MTVLAIANRKGGVGKTTTSVNLGAALAERGRKVLIIDADPQCNATTGLGLDSGRHHRLYEALTRCARGETIESLPLERVMKARAPKERTMEKNPESTLLESTLPESTLPESTLFVLPASRELAAVEVEWVQLPQRAQILRQLIDPHRRHWDYVLIDCPPSLSLLTLNALVAADQVLVPLQCEYFALEGLSELLRSLKHIKARLNPSLSIRGVVLTMYDRRNSLSALVAEDVRQHLNFIVMDTIIPRNVRVSESPSHGLPVIDYDRNCAGARAYQALADELIKPTTLKPPPKDFSAAPPPQPEMTP